MTTNTRKWLHGLGAAAIGGGASAITSSVTVGALAPDKFNFGNQLGHMLIMVAALFVVNGVLSAMAYLKQSPLPSDNGNGN